MEINKYVVLLTLVLVASCNSLVITHTQGTAEDVVDSTNAPQTTVSPSLEVPVSALK
jgi:hypothetical protein